MNQRKQKLIDKTFQLHTTYSLMGIFFIIIGIIIITIGINYYNDNKKIEKIIEKQNSIVNAQTEIINSTLQIMSIKSDNNSELRAKIREKSDANSLSMNKNINVLKELTRRNSLIFLIIIIFFIATGFILYPVLIRKTHKISGPVYLMSGYMKDVMNGNYPDIRPLRKKDELKEFYSLFSRFINFIKKRDNETK